MTTQNKRFENFLNTLSKSRMDQEAKQEETVKFVRTIETNYMDTIVALKDKMSKVEKLARKKVAHNAQTLNTKTELEAVFVDCIEDVRKEIMRRRLRNEIYSKKKFSSLAAKSAEASEFEESLLKLA